MPTATLLKSYSSKRFYSVVLGLSATVVIACDSGSESRPARESAEAARLSEATPLGTPTPVVVPGLDDETSWFGQVAELDIDADGRRLLALDAQTNRVVEFSITGDLVAVYGATSGRGPDEVFRLAGFAFNDSIVALLDVGNSKTLLYKRGGALLGALPSSPTYSDVALLGNRLVYVPSTDQAGALDIASIETAEVRAVGTRDDLPIRCSTDDCADRRANCSSCRLAVFGDTMITIVSMEDSQLTTITSSGDVVGVVDLLERNQTLRHWYETDRPYVEEANEQAGGQFEEVKSYLQSPVAVQGGGISSSVVPSIPVFRERGYEYWIFNPGSGVERRYSFPRKKLGFLAVGAGPVYALDIADGGIYRLEMPHDVSSAGVAPVP